MKAVNQVLCAVTALVSIQNSNASDISMEQMKDVGSFIYKATKGFVKLGAGDIIRGLKDLWDAGASGKQALRGYLLTGKVNLRKRAAEFNKMEKQKANAMYKDIYTILHNEESSDVF